MKKILSLIAAIIILSCSTSSDDNGNSSAAVVPLAPTELDGALVNNQVALTWVDNSTNETGFKIDRKVGAGNWVADYASVNADVVNYTDTSVSEGMTYSYRASSFNAVGKSLNYSNIYTVTITAGITLPTLSTTAVTGITNSTVLSGGNISNDGGAAITTRGVCWSTSSNPTIALTTKTTDGAGSGAFTSNMTGLAAGTTYYIRAYATNSIGTAYGNEINFTTLQNATGINIAGPNVTDIDGNTYQSVTNCGLTFTKENLNVSKYSDGTPIPQVQDPAEWASLTTGAWCYYNNDPANEAVYGKLYNWYAVMGIYNAASAANAALRKKLAPTGWHISTDAEWTQLSTCLYPNAVGDSNIAGGKMKATGTIQAGTGLWESPNEGATNESGFTAIPGGCRMQNNPTDWYFLYIGSRGVWWSSSASDNEDVRSRTIYYSFTFLQNNYPNRKDGCSVRCVKN
jgi:uncharacterized protein (TIGR02145 family)